MSEALKKIQIIRCKHERKGKRCNNIICKREGATVIVKRHGREIRAGLFEFSPVIITCERCGEITRISVGGLDNDNI